MREKIKRSKFVLTQTHNLKVTTNTAQKIKFSLQISSEEPADLATCTENILHGNFIFCAVKHISYVITRKN